MNSWWLKLYTVPHLKKLGITYFILTTLACLVFKYAPDLSFLMIGAYAYPFYTVIGASDTSFAANIDFHKMSVPLKDLRKIFYFDIFIQSFTFLFCAFLSIYIPLTLFLQPSFQEFNPFFLFTGSPSVTILSSTLVISFLITVKSNRYNKATALKKRGMLKPQTLVVAMPVIAAAYLVFSEDQNNMPGAESGDGLNKIFLAVAFFTSLTVASIFHFSKQKFHIIREYGNWKESLFTFAKPFAGTLVLCLMCGFISRYEINSNHISLYSKAKILIVYSDFLPEIETDTVVSLMNEGSFMADVVFKNASREVYQIPVEQVIKKKDLYAYKEYLKNGRPTESNLVYIMRELEHSPNAKDWQNNRDYKQAKQLLVYHWPAAKTLPDDLIFEKVTRKKRAVASDVKGP